MTKILSFLALVLLSAGALAGPTEIAQLPLLNISGTGTVRPNLMLLYDNSGSMRYAFTPDYVDDYYTCRAAALMSDGTHKCRAGDPPFNSADFNRQYYNPKIVYIPPVKADGTSYNSLNKANTTSWTKVTIDGFGVNDTDLQGNLNVTTTDLVTGFPDLRWCVGDKDCGYNTATYTYPSGNRIDPKYFTANPYYYTINVAEYCSDATLTSCKTTAVGGDAPTGFTVPAKVRWCNSSSLKTCRAKYDSDTYKYPRFSNPNGGVVPAFGTITINASAGNSSREITSVSVGEPSGAVVITNGKVTAATGTNASSERAALAVALAGSIIAKTKLTNQYIACVRTPSNNSGVPACADYGITLVTDNVVAVMPLDCIGGATSKAVTQCSLVADDTRNGWALSVVVPSGSDPIPTVPTALNTGAAVFVRTDIVPARSSYPKDANRVDCAGTTCTYEEEMTNFANWYGYYRTRNQLMKTAVGHAFRPITETYNVGLVSLSVAAAEGSMTPPQQFTGDARTLWYDALYAMDGDQSTPIRQALHAIGKLYANQSPYVKAAGKEVVQYPCQQNFTFVTTDGYWNGGAATTVTSNDQAEDVKRFCLRGKGCVDPTAQTKNSLADVALYWYNGGSNTGVSSLRPSLEDMTKPGVVPAAAGENTRLHMNTYALGLGVDGVMNYEPNYDTAASVGGDFYKLITGATSGCPWNGNGAYVWPDPKTGDSDGGAAYQSRVDDLWHAAINGHGKYFSASEPKQVVEGLRSALANIEVKVGAAAAAATSTPNISQYDNDIFSATFTTVKWFGELQDRKIDPATGVVGTAAVWSTTDTVGLKVDDESDSRKILMRKAGGGLQDFTYANLAEGSIDQGWFKNKCSALAQCANLSTANRAIVDDGATIVNWLRGQQKYANDTVLRAYARADYKLAGRTAPLPIVLGDIASSKPAFMREPRKAYSADGYADFKVEQVARKATVFAAANDGMLHAFDAATGAELWAYVPRITMKKLHLQASTTYGTNHQFTTDGSPEVADVKIGTGWKTVLVAGLNGGGRGYYALDVTDPAAPKALWELCADGNVCSGINNEPNLGLTFGNPQFGTWKKSATDEPQWVVFLTSGYNNVPGTDGVAGGDGKGYLFIVDIATGQVLKTIGTTATGTDLATPSGLAKITAISANPQLDPLVTYVYGGDNLGRMWRFDLTVPGAPGVVKMGDAGVLQPITTRPDVTMCAVDSTVDGATTTSAKTVVVFGTGRLLHTSDIPSKDVQAAYVLKDSGSGITPAQWRNTTDMARQTLAKVDGSGDGGDTYTISGTAVDLDKQVGWYVDFDKNVGERVNLDPKIVGGGLMVVTNIPRSSSDCSVGGTSNIYQLNVCTGRPVDGDAGRTLSNTSAAVGTIVISLPDGEKKVIVTNANGRQQTEDFGTVYSLEARKAGWRRVKN